jgi:hypothetical protein
MKLLFKLTLFALLLLPGTALAEIPKGMQDDFAPTSGYIIMPIGDEFLVDLDASSNLREGDILTLVMPGEKVIHPVTKEVLGSLDIPKGYLQVSRIKSGYSYAKLLFSETPPQKGDQIKRFEQVPTSFSSTEPAEQLLADLKTGLPQLNWLPADSSQQPLLTFELKGNLLTVKNAAGTTLKNYQLVDGELVAPASRRSINQDFTVDADPAKNKGLLNRTVNKIADKIGLGGSEKGLPGQVGIIRNQQLLNQQGIWMNQNLEGETTGILVSDLDNDGQLETLVAIDSQLLVFQINQGQMQEEAKLDLPPASRILNIDSLTSKTGQSEIYVSVVRNENVFSQVIGYSAEGYQVALESPWLLRVVDLPGEGRTLIGQQTDDFNRPFVGKPFRVHKNDQQLQKGEELSLPRHAQFYSFHSFPAASGGNLFAYLTQDDYLKVATEGGQGLWESADYFGGSEIRLFTTVEKDGETVDPVYIQPRIVNGPEGEILVAQNDGLRALRRFRMFKDSRVIALSWNGFAFQESWRTAGLNGYLTDFTLADADNDGAQELVMAVKFKHKSVLENARSAIVIYELN